MRNRILFFLFILFSALPVFSQIESTAKSTGVLSSLKYFSTLYPREEGSDGEKKALEYIKTKLESYGVEYTETDFTEMENSHSFSRNLSVDIPGKTLSTIIIAVPLDQEENALPGKDGSINLSLALSLIETYAGNAPPVSIKFLFLGGAFSRDLSYPMGILRFLEDFSPKNPISILFFNFRSIPEKILIHLGGRHATSPAWILRRCSSAFLAADLNFNVRGEEYQIFRLGLTDTVTSIEPFLSEGYPAVELTGAGSAELSGAGENWTGTFITGCNFFFEENRNGFPEGWDRHFILFKLGDRNIIVTEGAYIGIFLGLSSLFFLYAILFKKRRNRYLLILGRHLGTLPVLFLFVFGCLLSGSFLLEAITVMKGYPDIWKATPFRFFLIKISSALFLFFLAFRFLRHRYFSIRGSYYTAASLLFLILTTIVSAIINISFSYYFIWAFIWAFIFSLLKSRTWKMICLLLSPLWLGVALYNIFNLHAFGVLKFILLSRLYGNLLLALFSLPFILMLIRLSLLYKHAMGRRQRLQHLFLVLSFAVIAISLSGYFFLRDPWEKKNQPVRASELIDLDEGRRYLALSSPAQLRPIFIKGAGYPPYVSRDTEKQFGIEGREIVLRSSDIPDLVAIRGEKKPFLDRRQIKLEISAEGDPESVTCELYGGGPELVIFDANFPFSLDPERNNGVIHIGRTPPNPLVIEFTLPREADVTALIHVNYKIPPYELSISGERMSFSKSLRIKKIVPLP